MASTVRPRLRPAFATHHVPRAGVAVAALLLAALAAFIELFHLGTPTWNGDELWYAQVGLQYVQDGNWAENPEHPFLGKEILGVFQVVFGASPGAARLAAALASFATGVFAFLLGRGMAGTWAGLGAAALWFLVPHAGTFGDGLTVELIRIDRYALLDVFMAAGIAGALFGGWRWSVTGDWRWAAATGALMGAAIASKAPGVLIAPAILLAGLGLAHATTRRSWLERHERAVLGVLGGVLILVSLALGWYRVLGNPKFPGTLTGFEALTRTETLFELLAVVGGAVALWRHRAAPVAQLVCGAVAAVLAARALASPPAFGGQGLEYLPGPVLALAGGLLLARGGMGALLARRESAPDIDAPARAIGVRAGQLALAALVAVLVIALTYLPVLDTLGTTLDQMRELQEEHGRIGHAVVLEGVFHDHPPWWANLAWMWEGVGALGMTALLGLSTAAILLVPGRPLLYLVVAALAPIVFLTAGPSFALPHYWFAWIVQVTLLAALGLAWLIRGPIPLKVLGVAALAAVAVTGAGQARDVAQLEPADYRAAATVLEDRGIALNEVAVWGYPFVLQEYLPGSGPAPEKPRALLVDHVMAARLPNPQVQDLLENHADEYGPPQDVGGATLYLRR